MSLVISCNWMMLDAIGDRLDKNDISGPSRVVPRAMSHALVDNMHKWHRAMDKRRTIRVIFIDFAKALMITSTIDQKRRTGCHGSSADYPLLDSIFLDGPSATCQDWRRVIQLGQSTWRYATGNLPRFVRIPIRAVTGTHKVILSVKCLVITTALRVAIIRKALIYFITHYNFFLSAI